MSKKSEQKSQKSQKSLKKSLLAQVEAKLSESLSDFPKNISEKKFRKSIQKAGKIITRSLATKPVKVTSKSDLKKTKKKGPEINKEVKAEAV